MSKKYVTDVIGEQYKDWKEKDVVIITTQTGSGKSTFILKKLLPKAIAENKHVVYICNRRIIKEQFEVQSVNTLQQILGTPVEVEKEQLPYIHIVSYQFCEQSQQYPDFIFSPDTSGLSRQERKEEELRGEIPKPLRLNHQEILYYVFDEAHYFLSDANFNSNTNYWVNKEFSKGISIFLTATPEPLMCFLGEIKSRKSIWNFKYPIYKTIKNKEKKRKKLEEKFCVKGKRRSSDFSVEMIPQNQIDEICREIQPFKEAGEWLASLIEGVEPYKANWHMYNSPANYDYICPVYFKNYSDLKERISNSQDKWMIFVDKIGDGTKFLESLNQLECDALFLNSKSVRKKGTAEYNEFNNIVEKQQFNCQVLIATSVMDCGVSIVDPAVKNVVISNPDRTAFLQMMGRRRISKDDETVNLYIKMFNARQINTLRYNFEKRLYFLLYYSLINEVEYEQVFTLAHDDDGMRARPFLTAEDENKVYSHLKDNIRLLYCKPRQAASIYGEYDVIRYENGKKKKLEELDPSTTAMMWNLYSYCNYKEAIDSNQDQKDKVFFLKRQLSWLGKVYDEKCWLDCHEVIRKISELLKNYCDNNTEMDSPAQQEFSKSCVEILMEFLAPSDSIGRIRRRLKNKTNNTIGKLLLNEAFEEVGLPYRIESRQKSVKKTGSRKTFWYIERQSQ